MKVLQIFLLLAYCNIPKHVVVATDQQNNERENPITNGFGSIQNSPFSSDLWIEQRLNHFDALDRRTWMQRYITTDHFYRSLGPGILYIGGESSFPNFHVSSRKLVIRLAERVGGKLFHLEHRFYGRSHPTNDTKVDNLRYLSSEQALADIAHFIQNISALPGNENFKKWILVGASYSGSLAVWMKIKYPHLVYGVVAASPPLEAKTFFNEYAESVNRTLQRYGGVDCYSAVARATYAISQFAKTTAGRRRLKKDLNLCNYLNSSPENMWTFNSVMNNNVNHIVQFSMNNILSEQPREVYVTINQMCRIMTSSTRESDFKRFAHLVKIKRNSTQCTDVSFDDFIEAYSNSTWGKQSSVRNWYYQICTEFGWFQTANAFPFLTVPTKFQEEICYQLFEQRLKPDDIKTGVKLSNAKYGGIDAVTSLSRTVLFNGGVDPWHLVSNWRPNLDLNSINILNTSPNVNRYLTDPNGFTSIFVDSSSHAEVMLSDTIKDSYDLLKARNVILELVAYWMEDSL